MWVRTEGHGLLNMDEIASVKVESGRLFFMRRTVDLGRIIPVPMSSEISAGRAYAAIIAGLGSGAGIVDVTMYESRE